MYCKIGTVDVTDYIAKNGWTETTEDMLGPNEGFSIDGNEIIDLLRNRTTIDIVLISAPGSAYYALQTLLNSPPFSVEYGDINGTHRTRSMKATARVATFVGRKGSTDYFNFSFQLIEV